MIRFTPALKEDHKPYLPQDIDMPFDDKVFKEASNLAKSEGVKFVVITNLEQEEEEE